MRRPWPLCSFALLVGVLGCHLGQPRTAAAQLSCEESVEQRLRQALGLAPGDTLYATRDYHPGLFPGWIFYRATIPTGFHTRPRWAAVIVRGTDTLVVRNLQDLARPWADVTTLQRRFPNQLALTLTELLFQSGFLSRADRVLRNPADIPEFARLSLDPQADVSQISAPAAQVSGGRTDVSMFLLTPDGVTRLRARTDSEGQATIVSDVIARAR